MKVLIKWLQQSPASFPKPTQNVLYLIQRNNIVDKSILIKITAEILGSLPMSSGIKLGLKPYNKLRFFRYISSISTKILRKFKR
jgi:hypothetical protein